MKKNILVTTGLVDTWEFRENNFILGKWCEFYEFNFFDKEKFMKKNLEIKIIKGTDIWDNNEEKIKDYNYIKKISEYLLEIISEKLSIIHNVNENKEYWRVIISNWLTEYTTGIFYRWESIRIFFEQNKNKKFYSNFILLNDSNYVPKDHLGFNINTQNDYWNHWVFLRIFNFLKIENLSLLEKKVVKNNVNKKVTLRVQNVPFINCVIKLMDRTISKFAFKYNKVILDTFYFPRNEYLKICLRCKLIPSKYLNFFDFSIKQNDLSKDNKRVKLKNLISKIDDQDKFIQFLLVNIYKDMPKSYLENFHAIKKKILPFAKIKKIIFSMHSLIRNDNFKIYIAEAKKIGSKYIHVVHGGGLDIGNMRQEDPRFNFFEKVSNKIIRWDNTTQKQNIYVNLSPTLPTIKLKNTKDGNNCTIVFYQFPKYIIKCAAGPNLVQTVNLFNKLTHFVNSLNSEIKSKIKFRIKKTLVINAEYNYEGRFAKMFGKKTLDTPSFKNTFEKTILNSKLIIATYPSTAFSEAMYSNIPTILIIDKNHWQLSEKALQTFNNLKENNIAFEDFNEAKAHINKYWKELGMWWKCENVQSSRKRYLINFFNVKPEWFKEWSDYIYFSKKL